MDPRGPLLAPLLALVPLERLPRTGWLLAGVAEPESVAAHVLGTAQVAIALGPRVSPPLDVDRATALAVVHDLPEALLTDLPRRAAELLPGGAKRKAEEAAARALLEPLSTAAAERFREYRDGATREARFARLCDKLHLGVRLVAYLRAGHRGLDDFDEGVRSLDTAEFAPCAELQREILSALDELRGVRREGS